MENLLPAGWCWRTWDTVANRYLGGQFPEMDKCRKQARAVARQMRLGDYKERFVLHLLTPDGEINSTHGWDAEEPDFSALMA